MRLGPNQRERRSLRNARFLPISMSLMLLLPLAMVHVMSHASAFAATAGFARTDVPVAHIPSNVAVADFNGDGAADMAVTDYGSNLVSILLNDGHGGFLAPRNYPTDSGPLAVAVGDLNGDGYADLTIVAYNADAVTLLLGDGAGGFSFLETVPVGSIPTSAALGDFNADGSLDMAVTSYASSSVSVLLNAGSGKFVTSTVAVGSDPRAAAVADFNADGRSDIVVSNFADATISILLGNGAGGFSRSDFPTGNGPRSLAVGDLNGDGRLDVVAGNYWVGTVSVLMNDGNGGFGPPTDVPVGTNPRGVAVADFDGDGKSDVVVTNNAVDSVSVLSNRGGAFVRNDYAVGNEPYGVAVGDFTGDDNPEVVTTNNGTDNVTVLTNLSSVPATAPTCAVRATIAGPPQQLVVGLGDARSGVAAVQVVGPTNASVRVPPFPRQGMFSEIDAVVTIGQTSSSQVTLRVTDGAGQTTTCSPAPSTTTTTTTTTTSTTTPPSTTTTTPPATTTTTTQGSGFVPSQVAGLQGWYTADGAGPAVDGSPVGSWTDTSGQGHTLSAPALGRRPTYQSNAIAGHAVLRFDGVDDLLQAYFPQSQPTTVFVLYRARSDSGSYQYVTDGFNNASMGHYISASAYGIYAGGAGPVATSPFSFGTVHLVAGVYNGVASAFYGEGGPAVTGNPGISSPNGLSVGSSGAGAAAAAVDVAEVVSYNRALSGTDIDRVGRYLAAKYATAWSAAGP